MEGDDDCLPICAEDIANLVSQQKIPVVVLNACRSGVSNPEASIAQKLASLGVPDVIAFRHSITLDCANIFAHAFYQSLFSSKALEYCVVASRRALYVNKTRRTGITTVELDDWLSIVHYSNYSRGVIQHDGNFAEPEKITHHEFSSQFEWCLRKLSKEVFIRKSLIARGKAKSENFSMISVYGGIGIGVDQLLIEASLWFTVTNPLISGSYIINFYDSLNDPLVNLIYQSEWSVVHSIIVKKAGSLPLLIILGLDFAIDSDRVTEKHFLQINELAKFATKKNFPILIASTKNFLFGPIEDKKYSHVSLYPLFFMEQNEWALALLRSNTRVKNNTSNLLNWLLNGYTDLIFSATKFLTKKKDTVEALDYLVFGLEPKDKENYPRIFHGDLRQIAARLHRISPLEKYPSLNLVMALFGSSITGSDLQMISENPTLVRFPKCLEFDFTSTMKGMKTLYYEGLVSIFSPNDWSAHFRNSMKESGVPYCFTVHPLLKPLFRTQLSVDISKAIDHWCVYWAVYKIKTFATVASLPNNWKETKERFNYGRPLYAAAIWTIIRKRTPGSIDLLRAIQESKKVGLWPSNFDIYIPNSGTLEDYFETITPKSQKLTTLRSDIKKKIEGCIKKGYELQKKGELDNAYESFLTAARYSRRYVISNYGKDLYMIGTVLIDKKNYRLANIILSRSLGFVSKYGPTILITEIYYELGSVHQFMGNVNIAKDFYREAIAHAKMYSQQIVICRSLQNLAALQVSYGKPHPDTQSQNELEVYLYNYKEAWSYLDEAIKIANEHDFKDEHPGNDLVAGEIEEYRDNRQGAKSFYINSIEGFKKTGEIRRLKITEERLKNLVLLP
jgi:tetratricopeptide (TPR) repeat protein